MGGIPVSTTSAIEMEIELAKKQNEEKHKQRVLEEEAKRIRIEKSFEKKQKEQPDRTANISIKDFVVRRSTFRCRNKGHQIKSIDATVQILQRNGNIVTEICPAGYCPNCGIYFIMDNTFTNLKRKGLILCRVSDEKSYIYGKSSVGEIQLADESVLKQFGYSVAQEDGLSEKVRHKLLALLIDKGAMSKSDIISYLNFFIDFHSNIKFEKAIEKWEKDLKFVEEYKMGSYPVIVIGGIKKK